MRKMQKENLLETEPKPLSELQIDNDFIFMLAMQNKDICKRLSEILLGEKITKIEFSGTQKKVKPFYASKSICLDAWLEVSGKVINIEMQTSHYEHLPLRARYYQCMLDSGLLKKGKNYETLKDTYLFFICKDDPFKMGYPIYTIKNYCSENFEMDVSDGTVKKFFNCSAYQDVADVELKAFLEYVSTYKVTDNFTKQLDDVIKSEKAMEENMVNYKSFNMVANDARWAGEKEGMQRGYEKAKAESERQIYRMSERIAELEKQIKMRG